MNNHYFDNNIQSWDDVVQFAANLRQDIDNNKFDLGDLVHWACPRRHAGRPKLADERWNVSDLARSIGVSQPYLSNLASNSEFFTEDIRDELPPQVSWSQLAEARRSTGWRPGRGVTVDLQVAALEYVQLAADGNLPRPETTVETYALRCFKAGEKGIAKSNGNVKELFITITETASDILVILEEK